MSSSKMAMHACISVTDKRCKCCVCFCYSRLKCKGACSITANGRTVWQMTLNRQACRLSTLPSVSSLLYIIAQLNTILIVLINKSSIILFVLKIPKGKAQVTNWCCQIPGRGQEYLDKEISQCWDITKFSVGLCCLWSAMKEKLSLISYFCIFIMFQTAFSAVVARFFQKYLTSGNETWMTNWRLNENCMHLLTLIRLLKLTKLQGV